MLRNQLRNEFVKMFARRRSYLGCGVVVATEIVILSLLTLPAATKEYRQLLINNGLSLQEGYTGLTMALFLVYLTVALMGVLYLALASSDLIAQEVEDGTMRMILARPIGRGRLFGVKVFVCVVHTFLFIFVIGITSFLVGVAYIQHPGNLLVYARFEEVFALFDPREGLWRFARGLVFLGLCYQAVSGLGLMFSSFRIHPGTATILTLSVVILDLVLRNISFLRPYEHFFLTHHMASWVLTFHYVVPWTDVLESVCYLAALTASCWVIGGTYFCARDFKR